VPPLPLWLWLWLWLALALIVGLPLGLVMAYALWGLLLPPCLMSPQRLWVWHWPVWLFLGVAAVHPV
jgi:hypothetical protein